MAISIAGSIGTIADTATVTGTMTFSSGANSFLAIAAGAHQQNVGTVTLNGTALTRTILGTTIFNEQIGFWPFEGPPSGGQGTIVVKAGGASGVGFIAAEFDGVAQTGEPAGSAADNLGNSATALGTITGGAANSWCVGAFYSEANGTADNGVNQTKIMYQSAQSFENMGMSYINQNAGTFSWKLSSGQRWAVAMINIEIASGAATARISTLGLMGAG